MIKPLLHCKRNYHYCVNCTGCQFITELTTS